ncbi:glycerol-3-phosphate acyltransferase 1, mitochondrial-like [Babylonia areolata]|uniref:glycerol-3-phosphate acyltransferase 1, mitochondrial-like n=1 Tax=Babylonia areolata TaxID=304850 RepID=UPI003FD3C375
MPADIAVFAGSRSGPQFGRRNPKRKPTSLLSEVQFDVDNLAQFKSAPSRQPEEFRNWRPYVGQCCRCMPISREDLHEPSHEELGIRNILDVDQQLKMENVWSTYFSKVVYAMRRPLFGPFPDLSMAVLTNRRVVEAVQKAAKELDTDKGTTDKIAVVEKRAAHIMKKMKASISTVFIKFTGWFLLKFLSVMHRGVLVHRGQMASVKKAAEKGLPMIYLPLHRSHLDYILITFILWNYDIRAPHVAAGDNMDIPFFSKLMRSLGGFFIRRRLDNGGNQKDFVYRAILNTYMLELLKKGESLEFFIEGGRTRTGRAIIPKGGLLSVVSEACTEGIIYDAYIVPVTFSYDRLLEGTFNEEQMGLPKVKESFIRACRAIIGVLTGDFGSVRVNFAQPFSLREFLQSAEQFPPETLRRTKSLSNASSSGLNLSQQALSLRPNGVTIDGQDTARAVVRALAEHTVYTSVTTQTPMSTHCLAFLFLTKHRQGGTLASLAEDLDWLREELSSRKVDVGFCGTADNAVLYAHSLLGEDVVRQSVSKDGDVMLEPNLNVPAVFTLSYNANSLTAAFAMESIIVCAIVLEAELMPSMWTPQLHVTDLPTVVKDNVMTTAHHLCDLLQFEFVLAPPCRTVADVLIEKMENFVDREILLSEGAEYDPAVDLVDRHWANRLAKSLEWDDDDDDEDMAQGYVEQKSLKVNVNQADICSKLRFLHVVLSPILESYLITAYYITQALTADMPEDEFMKKLASFAQDRAKNKLVMHIESCGLVTLKNAVKAFQHLNILETYREANLTMVTLTEHVGVRERLHHYIDILKVARS